MLEECLSPAIDVWALGRIFYELKDPLDDLPEDLFPSCTTVEEAMQDRDLSSHPFFIETPSLEPSFRSLVCAMLQKDPKERISASKALSVWEKIYHPAPPTESLSPSQEPSLLQDRSDDTAKQGEEIQTSPKKRSR